MLVRRSLCGHPGHTRPLCPYAHKFSGKAGEAKEKAGKVPGGRAVAQENNKNKLKRKAKKTTATAPGAAPQPKKKSRSGKRKPKPKLPLQPT